MGAPAVTALVFMAIQGLSSGFLYRNKFENLARAYGD